MATNTAKQAKVLTPQELQHMRYPLPRSWTKAAGILKGKRQINPLTYQKEIRKEWDSRLKKLQQITDA